MMHMPLQNRVRPDGYLEAVPVRYATATAAFGNRGGQLHNKDRKITKSYHSKTWLACKLHVDRKRKVQLDDNRAFNGRKRILMRPGFYTELFFLDQYVATAAGHRPCACCRHKDYTAFMQAWTRAHGLFKLGPTATREWKAGRVDEVLHIERDQSSPIKPHSRTLSQHNETLSALPDGAFVSLKYASSREWQLANGDSWLCWRGHLLKWSHDGYCERRPISSVEETSAEVTLLTPKSMVAAMRHGFVPGEVHPSADALLTE